MTLTKTKTLPSICSYAKSRACLQFADRYHYQTKRIILVKNVIQQTNQYVFVLLKCNVMVILVACEDEKIDNDWLLTTPYFEQVL